jgi:hypothetical protein
MNLDKYDIFVLTMVATTFILFIFSATFFPTDHIRITEMGMTIYIAEYNFFNLFIVLSPSLFALVITALFIFKDMSKTLQSKEYK